MKKTSRRSVLRCCLGATVGTIGATGITGAIPDSEKPNYFAKQAQFVVKHMEKVDRSFEQYTDIFDPPTNEKLVDLFVESFTPSLSTLLPGLLGKAADLKETLKWYKSVGEHSMFALISRYGVSTDGERSYKGSGGDGMAAAKGEINDVSEQCNVVIEKAQACVSNPSKSATDAMVDEMETLATELGKLKWVRRWSNIDASAYQNVARGTPGARQRTIERIANNAQAVLDIASAVREDVAAKAEIMASGDILPFPAAIVKFNNNVSDIRSQAPNWAFNQIAGDSFHIVTQTDAGDQMTVRWINTDSDGQIDTFEVVEQDSANADIVLSEDVRDEITSADNPISTAQKAYDEGKVELSGNGFANQIKYDGGELLSELLF
ncbi:hypothetical protein [Halobellus inordinatus]|uniref:hypothetical protein n=1 Tax=Halobellus inordinatus TaxID=1126236 RepID=UPI00210E5936|nr:hypothetical protein [Halobellus inordinatus]